SPDGKKLAFGAQNGAVMLWDTGTEKEPRVLRGHAGLAWPVAFAPNGQTLASGGADRTVRLWDTVTGASTSLEGHASTVRSLAFASDGQTLTSAGADGALIYCDLAARRARNPVAVAQGRKGVTLSPDSRQLVTWDVGVDTDGVAKLWQVAPLKERTRCQSQ